MSRFCRPRGSIGAILFLHLLTVGCSRPTAGLHPEGAAESHATPFQGKGGGATDVGNHSYSSNDPSETEVPFQTSRVLPAGTLLIVRLKATLVASGSESPFEGALDEPIVMDGDTVVPRDATVSGRIESAHLSKAAPERGYVRLVLNSVEVDGVSVPIQTASLFARQRSAADVDSRAIRLHKGRRLTFRLKEPVFFRDSTRKAS
jgi:hypothetical protein